MMIRRYIVRDMPEAVVLIRRELGKDAVILSSKRVTTKKWMGIWRSKRIEVLAATGDDVPVRVHGLDVGAKARAETPSRTQPERSASYTARREVAAAEHAPAESATSFVPATGYAAVAAAYGRQQADAVPAPATTEESPQIWERANPEDVIRMNHPEPIVDQPAVSGNPSPDTSVKETAALDDVRKQIEDMKKLLETTVIAPTIRPPLVQQLLRQGVAEEHVVRMMENLAAYKPSQVLEEGVEPAQKIRQRDLFMQRAFEELSDLTQARPIAPSSRVVAMVGPTGVGKTTTIAKLAALQVLAGKRRVGLLTMDTYRIAAVDQLKTYANILNVPLEVVYQPSELPRALERMADCDLVLIDTAGRNYRMDMHVAEIQALLKNIPVDETFLVLSLTSKPDDLHQIAGAFEALPIDKLLFTKLDETSTYGAILNLLYTYRKPLSYITKGQNVPDDIEVASVEKILRLILGGVA